MKKFVILTLVLILLFFMAIENVSAINKKIILDKYNISFSLNTSDVLTQKSLEPIHENGYTGYACELIKSPGQKFGPAIMQFDDDVTSALSHNASDSNTRLWLAGLYWMIDKNFAITPSVTGWSATVWLNNKTLLVFTGNILQEEFDRIRETLSVKENGKEIYQVSNASVREGLKTQPGISM